MCHPCHSEVKLFKFVAFEFDPARLRDALIAGELNAPLLAVQALAKLLRNARRARGRLSSGAGEEHV